MKAWMIFSVTPALSGYIVVPSNLNRSQHKLQYEAETSIEGLQIVQISPGSDL